MGSFGPNFANNFAGIAISLPIVLIPTSNVTENLCNNIKIKKDLNV